MTFDETLGSNLTNENTCAETSIPKDYATSWEQISYFNYFYRTALELSVRFIKQM